MKVREYLDKLLLKLEVGDLQYVAKELKSYFKTMQQDSFWIKQSEDILNSLKDVNNNGDYTEETRKLKIQNVKDELHKIITTIKDKTDVEIQIEANISNVPKEEFEGLVDLQKATISIKSKGERGTINNTGKIFIGSLIILAILVMFSYYFSTRTENVKTEIINCDCSKLKDLKINVEKINEIYKKRIDSLDNEITIIKSKELSEARIQQKDKLLGIKRKTMSRIDNIARLILPEIEFLASQCPYQNCNNSINEILNKLNN
jgi:hypothetical protein